MGANSDERAGNPAAELAAGMRAGDLDLAFLLLQGDNNSPLLLVLLDFNDGAARFRAA